MMGAILGVLSNVLQGYIWPTLVDIPICFYLALGLESRQNT